eukprot:1745291-Pyramimonas_sp.AAC.1
MGEPHADCATGTFGAGPHGARKRCTGWGRRMRTAPGGPSVEPHGATKRCNGGDDVCDADVDDDDDDDTMMVMMMMTMMIMM